MTSIMHFPLRTEPEEAAEPAPDIADAAPEVTVPAPSPAPLVLLEGDRMTQRAQFLAALTHAFRVARRRARDLSERDGGLPASLLAGKSPSVLEQHEYAQARNWVPSGHDGGTAEGMGVIYHWLVGRPGVAVGNSISAISARPFRWCVTAGITLVIANVALYAFALDLAAILTDLGTSLLIAAWAGAGHLLMRIMSTQPAVADGSETDGI